MTRGEGGKGREEKGKNAFRVLYIISGLATLFTHMGPPPPSFFIHLISCPAFKLQSPFRFHHSEVVGSFKVLQTVDRNPSNLWGREHQLYP